MSRGDSTRSFCKGCVNLWKTGWYVINHDPLFHNFCMDIIPLFYSPCPSFFPIRTIDDFVSISGSAHSGLGRWHVGLLGAKTHLG